MPVPPQVNPDPPPNQITPEVSPYSHVDPNQQNPPPIFYIFFIKSSIWLLFNLNFLKSGKITIFNISLGKIILNLNKIFYNVYIFISFIKFASKSSTSILCVNLIYNIYKSQTISYSIL